MQTGTIEIAKRKSELTQLVSAAQISHRHCEAARSAVESGQQLALYYAWQTGVRLNRMKELVGFGDWMDWLELNFLNPLKISYQTAALYMRIDAQNEHLRSAKLQRAVEDKPDLEAVKKLKFDSVRKYATSFVPSKERPQQDDDVRFPRLVHHLNLVNEFEKVKRKHETDGLSMDELRRDLRGLYEWLRDEIFVESAPAPQ